MSNTKPTSKSVAYEEIPWTFLTWIKNFKDVDLPIGDLAKDILMDINFPQEDSYEIIYNYLINRRADYAVIETFSNVWNFYISSK